jgi:pSer/pThr/pTyr-binding forkhead associated (FHA) protein
MQKCVNCGHENRPGVMFCENCGVSLADEAPMETKSIDASTEEEKAQLGVEESVLLDVRVQGTAIFQEKDLLRLDIEGSSEPIVLKPEAETIFGRRDPATGAMPDVDLTPFAGYRMGVSRRHAAIRFGDEQILNLWDLGSSNGTYLNGERLNAHRPYRLHDGDELRLGQMMIRVHFQSPSAAPPPSEKAETDVWVEAKEEKAAEPSPAQPVETETNIYKTPAASVEKRAGIAPQKPPEEPEPIELGPPKEQPVKPAASTEPPADLPDGVITLPPVAEVVPESAVKIEKPEQKPVEKSEPPSTVSFDDEQRAELDAQAAPPTATEKETEATDQKTEKPEADSAVPPAKPEDESQDKKKRD